MRIGTLLFLVVLFGVLIGAFFWYMEAQYTYNISTAVDFEDTQRIPFTVDTGEGVKSIGKDLEEKGLITSSGAFYNYVKRSQLDKEIEAGRFVLQPSYTIPEIVDYLTRSLSQEVPVTIREGLTIAQVDDYLAEEGILEDGAFEECSKSCRFDFDFLASKPDSQSLEGYLFPDTYFLSQEGTNAEVLITRMLRNFENRTAGIFPVDGRSVHEVVTMASIIEKEERNSQEKSTVSGVLWKRLDNGVSLGADATVRYVLNKWTEPLYNADLAVDSPYNTRKYSGLPPGPIGNAGLGSIEAAAQPEASEYWYYLHSDDGVIHYARTNEEHIANKQRYL